MTETHSVCLIEDDDIMRISLSQRFSIEGIACESFADPAEAIESLLRSSYALLICDINLPGMSGEELYKRLLDSSAAVPPTIFITGYGTVDQAVRLMRLGINDYISKPFDLDELLVKLEQVSPSVFGSAHKVQSELGPSRQMTEVVKTLQRLSGHRVDLLVTGESGVGKEYAARFYARQLGDQGEPFVAVNCAALPEDLLEAELFGSEKGAYTGALSARKGLFEQANTGVLFLDEVGEMSPALQAKLLRCIQDRSIRRIGGDEVIPLDLRLIYATNRNLQKLVQGGKFREDLYYRINVAHVHIPPLRERPDDIIWMANLVIEKFRQNYRQRKIIIPMTQKYLRQQPWPGNLRELANAVERACILSDEEVLDPSAFGDAIEYGMDEPADPANLKQAMQDFERQVLLETLKHHHWRIKETASSLDISRKNLWEKMKKHGIHQPQSESD